MYWDLGDNHRLQQRPSGRTSLAVFQKSKKEARPAEARAASTGSYAAEARVASWPSDLSVVGGSTWRKVGRPLCLSRVPTEHRRLNKGQNLAHEQDCRKAKRHKTREPFITQNRKLLTKSETVLAFNTLAPPDGAPISSTLSPSILDTKARQAGSTLAAFYSRYSSSNLPPSPDLEIDKNEET